MGLALSVWLAPLVLPEAGATAHLGSALTSQYRLFQLTHVAGLAIGGVTLLVMLTDSVTFS